MSIEITKDDLLKSSILFICRRSTDRAYKVRMFKSNCGSKITFNLRADNSVIFVTSDRAYCKIGCEACEQKISEVREIIKKKA
jgi:hypothetical protein